MLPFVAALTLAAPAEVPADRVRALARGTSITNWAQRYWGNENWKDPDYVPSARLRDLRRMGFTAIRLPVAAEVVFDPARPDEPKNLPYLDAILRRLLDAGLAVTLDFHYSGEEPKVWFGPDPARREAFRRFWRALAAHYRPLAPDRLFYEVMNEPVWTMALDWNWDEGRRRWWAYQGELIAAIREADPGRTLIVGADGWNGYDPLRRMTPYRDRNLVYNFHFYTPMEVTHQGASWAGPELKPLREVPYPPGPGPLGGGRIEGEDPDGKGRAALERYAAARWNAAKLGRELDPIAAWGRAHRVPLLCNEFGVLRDVAPKETVARWLRDVRTALERRGIGWSQWCYEAGGYGMLDGIMAGGSPVTLPPDPVLSRALGLRPPRREEGGSR